MLRTIIRSDIRDLNKAEKIVKGSSSDYLIVRLAGLSPPLQPDGQWRIITELSNDKDKVEIAKTDVAAFMLQEALKPTLSKTAKTVGGVV